ncbi:unnamed protein product [Spirodela intermedia]|uniref:GAGA-binding transcriptional activator n=1 Tax=Spirodela intermedia TaxID=51605 RepID=A0A7I8IY32_SPIIN|nr:unnamed protein product [Spirodela intermedia]CAA6662777.1 unnamed protein product [Spirodela intermedia]
MPVGACHPQWGRVIYHLNPPPLPLPPTAYSHSGDMQVIAAVPVYFCSANGQSTKKGRKAGKALPTAAASAPTQLLRLPKRSRKSGQEPDSQAAAAAAVAVAGGELRFEWKDRDAGLRQVDFDESTMPPPVCSCTGMPQRCYKWGRGGWQSSCCTPTMSMYPLPFLPVKRHGRPGGGRWHDLSTPLDLKDHWAKHGTNGWITIK